MKFFCEQCKAKYQIADDKVVGKTVRMKCRKCGHLIELRAEVTESSASAGLSAGPSGVGLATGGSGGGEAASRSLAPKPPARPPPKPNALATSLTAAKPPPPKPSIAPSSALAGAFKSNVQRDHREHREEESSTPFDMADLAPGDDWYVAVNGVPVGPIRIAEIRRKAALGAVTEDSLVWQEGLDEWRPLRTFPDLATNVREAATSGRISFTPPPPDLGRSSVPPPRPSMRGGPPSGLPGRMSPSRPQTGIPAPVSRSNVVPFTSRLATAERLEDQPTEIAALSALAAEPRFVPTPAPAAALTADPFAVPPPPQAPSAMAPLGTGGAPIVAAASLAPPRRQRKPPPLMAYALIAGATAFGGMLGYSLFLRPAPAPAPVVQVTVPAVAPTPTAAPTAATVVVPTAEPTASAVTTAVITGHGPTVAQASKTPTAPTSTGRSLDLHGIGGGGIQPGEEPGGEGPAAPGQCLSSGQVQQVIGNHQVALRRACWERNPTTKPTVNVSVSMTVGADGSAQSVSASGDEPSVANCIQNDVRGWRFPAMGCSQKTGFSFKFVRQ